MLGLLTSRGTLSLFSFDPCMRVRDFDLQVDVLLTRLVHFADLAEATASASRDPASRQLTAAEHVGFNSASHLFLEVAGQRASSDAMSQLNGLQH